MLCFIDFVQIVAKLKESVKMQTVVIFLTEAILLCYNKCTIYYIPSVHNFNRVSNTFLYLNPFTPNDPYRGLTAPLTSKVAFYIFIATNIGTEYFKHGIYSPFFSLFEMQFHNSNVFGSCTIHILYIYSTNIGTEYFKHGIYSPFFSLQNAVCFIILTYLVPVLFTFYIQVC